jgi:ABC-type multidrug transport system fused ATPase/permease subunit
VLSHLRPHGSGIVLGSALSLAGSLLALAQPLVVKRMVDALGDGRPALGALAVLSALVVVGAATAALGQYVLERHRGVGRVHGAPAPVGAPPAAAAGRTDPHRAR